MTPTDINSGQSPPTARARVLVSRRLLLAAGFTLLAAAFVLCFLFHAEHSSSVLCFEAEEPAAVRLSPSLPGPTDGSAATPRSPATVEVPAEPGVSVRIVASWGLKPELECDRERLRAELPRVPEALDGLRVLWRAESDGVERVVGEQRLAEAPADGPTGWSRVPPPFLWHAASGATLRATLEPTPDAGGIALRDCWLVHVVGQRTLSLRARDVAALALVPLALALVLAGMWRRPGTPPGEVEEPPRWSRADALVPVGLFFAFQLFGALVPWGASDPGRRVLEQVPFNVALGLGLALAAARRRTRTPLAALGGRPAGSPAWIAVGVGVGALLALAAGRLVGVLLPTNPVAAVLCVPGNVLAFGAAAGVAALAEELFWRGLAFEAAASWIGVRGAVVATALPFTAAHWLSRVEQPWTLGIIAVLAAALGLLRARTGSVVPCVALHATYNLSLVLLGQLAAG